MSEEKSMLDKLRKQSGPNNNAKPHINPRTDKNPHWTIRGKSTTKHNYPDNKDFGGFFGDHTDFIEEE